MLDKQKKHTKRIILISALVFFAFQSLLAQVNIKAVAGLQYSISSKQKKFFEGFDTVVSGSFSQYQSHRSGNNRDSAYVARTLGGESTIEWKTVPVPSSFKGDSVSFIWSCGFGNNLGNGIFDLTINDGQPVAFETINNSAWNVFSKDGIHLSFTTVKVNSNGANLGYMVLTIPRSKLHSSSSLKLKISGRTSSKEIWYRLFAYKNNIAGLLANEFRDFFSQVDFTNYFEARLTVVTSKKYSGKKLVLLNANKVIGESTLELDGNISQAEIIIPRRFQESFSTISINRKVVDTIFWSQINNERLRAFMEEELICESYIFAPKSFPNFRWKNEAAVEHQIGKVVLTVSYYNEKFQKVEAAEKTGRYGAVIEGKTKDNFLIKRYVTLFCADEEFDDYSKSIPIKMNNLNGYGINKSNWDKYLANYERFSFGSMKMYPKNNSDAAVFLAGLAGLTDFELPYETPRVKDRQWWIEMKRVLEKHYTKIVLKEPIKENNSDSILLADSFRNNQYDINKINLIREVCEKWYEKSGVPHVTVIVNKDKIIFQEAFGQKDNTTPLTSHTPLWMASITKLLTGTLMMQFVDQNLIDLNDPVGKYLPELSSYNNLTVNHLFTHLTGLEFAGEWASDWNYFLENQVAHIMHTANVGSAFSYNRVGYAIASKIMEQVTGKSLPSLFYYNLFKPLGMETAYCDNSYGGLYCSAVDLARFAQMLLNKGNYNGTKYFSETSYEKMLPKKLSVGDRSWGIGTSPMNSNGLSESAFGHSAASGSVLRIDPENELIIISARNIPGKYHSEFESELIKSCMSLLSK